MLNDVFAANMKRLRKLNRMTQDKLSKLSCIPRICIARYEAGKFIPKLDIAAKIADTLGVTVDALIKDGETDGRGE